MSFWKILNRTPKETGEKPVHLAIRSAGLCCAVGYYLKAAQCALRANMDHFQESEFLSATGDPVLVARLPETTLWGQARLARWLEMAIGDALHNVSGLDTSQVPLLWMAPEPERYGADLSWYTEIFDLAVKQYGRDFHPASAVLTEGRAGLASALGEVSRLLESGEYPYVLLAGVDSYLDSRTINHYLHEERLLIPGNSDGFLPGEAAAAVLLEKAGTQTDQLRVLGYGQAQEAGGPDGNVPNRAQGLAQAIRAALSSSHITYDELEFRISDQNGEAFFAREAANAMTRVATTGGEKLPLLTMADSLGEIGAATGPAILAYLSTLMSSRFSPGRNGLVHLANDNGLRCALVLQYPA